MGSKVYLSCLGVLKEQAYCSFQFRGFKDKSTPCQMYLQGENTKEATGKVLRGWKATSQVRVTSFQLKIWQGRYLWCPQRLKCVKEGATNIFRNFKAWRKVWLMLLEANRQEKIYDWWSLRLKANKRGAPNVFTCLTAWAKVLVIHLAVRIPEESYIYSI